MKKIVHLLICVFTCASLYSIDAAKPILPGGNDRWQLFWNDEFDYPDFLLDNAWTSANDSTQANILCARIRRNVLVSNGTLRLMNKKENCGTKAWTSGSIWTKRTFQYGYFECRYKYAAATGTNNSFWFMSSGVPTLGKKFEIDINEGHYPSEMATNVHNWTDITTNPTTGAQTHPSSSKSFSFAVKPDVGIQLEIPITTRKVRLTSNYSTYFHLQEFRIYNVNSSGYPTVLSPTADTDVAGLVNYARDAQTTITSSGVYAAGYEEINAADGGLTKHWVSQAAGQKWIEFDFPSDKTIGCIQFISGWLSGSTYVSVLNDYKVQYFDGTNWIDIQSVDAASANVDFGRDYHYLGLKWTADSLAFYHDGVEMRRVKNDFCYSGAPLYLSEAIISWAGAVTDAINGTQMEVDYVRAYLPLSSNEKPNCITNGGFENYTSTTDWQYLKESGSASTYTLVKTDPAEKLVSMRITAKASANPYGTYLTQRMAVPATGLYELRFKARSSNVTVDNNKFRFKIVNAWSDQSIILNDTAVKWVRPTSTWQTYSYKVNLKEDYSGRITFGFANAGVFDLDSVALVRIGNVDLTDVRPTATEWKSDVYASNGKIVVKSNVNQVVEIYTLDGSLVAVKEILAGVTPVVLDRKGLYIVRLKSSRGFVTKKIIL